MAQTNDAMEANIKPKPTTEDTENAKEDNDAVDLTSEQTFLLVLSLSLSTFIAALEQTIISNASDSISKAFDSSELDFTWIGTAYLLPAAAATPPWGKLSDIFGRKPVLMITIAVFWLGSLVGALAININMLIAGRAIQGIGGGGILGLSATVIGDVFSPRERSKYYGVLSVVWGLSCGLGPIIGDAFCEYVTWRWCFWINLPVAGVAGVLIFLFLKVETPRTPIVEGLMAMDWLGTIIIVGSTVMFLLGLGYGGGVAYPWTSATVICLVVFGIVTFVIYALIEWKVAKYPITPLRLFKSTSNIATFGIAYIHGAVYMANFYYLPIYFQSILGASPILSGVYLLPVAVILCVASSITGVYISKTGRYRPPIYFGLAMMILAHGLYCDLQTYASWPRIIIFQLIAGVGLGPVFQAPIIAIFSLTKPADTASAAATVLFTREIATAMSVVFGGVIFQNRIVAYKSDLDAALPASLEQKITSGSATTVTDEIRALPRAQHAVVTYVYNKAIRDEWIFYAALSGAALVLSLLISKQVLSREHKMNKTGLDVQEASRLEELEKQNEGKDEGFTGEIPPPGTINPGYANAPDFDAPFTNFTNKFVAAVVARKSKVPSTDPRVTQLDYDSVEDATHLVHGGQQLRYKNSYFYFAFSGDYANGNGTDISWKLRNDFYQCLQEMYETYHLTGLSEWTCKWDMQGSLRPCATAPNRAPPFDMVSAAAYIDAPETESNYFDGVIDAFRAVGGGSMWGGKQIFSSELGAHRDEAYAITWPVILNDCKINYVGGVNRIVAHGYPRPDVEWPGLTTFEWKYSEMYGARQPSWAYVKEMGDWIAWTQLILQTGVPRVHLSAQVSDNTVITNGLLAENGPGFSAFVVDNYTNITVEAVNRFVEWAEDDFPILFVGDVPETTPYYCDSCDEYVSKGMQKLLQYPSVKSLDTEAEVVGALDELNIQPSAINISPCPILYVHRIDDPNNVDYYWVYNSDIYANHATEASIKGNGIPYELDAWTGAITPIVNDTTVGDRFNIWVDLRSNQSTIVAFAPDGFFPDVKAPDTHVVNTTVEYLSYSAASNAIIARSPSNDDQEIVLSNGTTFTLESSGNLTQPPTLGPWNLTVQDWLPNPSPWTNYTSALEYHTLMLDDLIPWYKITGLQYTSGIGTYTTKFTWTRTPATSGALLDLGPVFHTIRLWINAQWTGPIDVTDAIVDITPYLRDGSNDVRIEVSSTLRDRLLQVNVTQS